MEPSGTRCANACRVVVSTPTALAAPPSRSHPPLSNPERPVPDTDDVFVGDRAFEQAERVSEAVHDRNALFADRGIIEGQVALDDRGDDGRGRRREAALADLGRAPRLLAQHALSFHD